MWSETGWMALVTKRLSVTVMIIKTQHAHTAKIDLNRRTTVLSAAPFRFYQTAAMRELLIKMEEYRGSSTTDQGEHRDLPYLLCSPPPLP